MLSFAFLLLGRVSADIIGYIEPEDKEVGSVTSYDIKIDYTNAALNEQSIITMDFMFGVE